MKSVGRFQFPSLAIVVVTIRDRSHPRVLRSGGLGLPL